MIKVCITVFFTFCTCTMVFCQAKSLRECIDIAWDRNITIKQAELGQWSSDIDLTQAKSARYPNLNAGSSLNISGRSVDPTNNQFATSSFFTNNYNLSSNVLLYRGGQVLQTIKRARQSRAAAGFQIDDIKQDIALQVANAYMNVLLSQENLGIAEKRKEATQQQISQLELLIDRGLRPKNAIYELRSTLAADEQNVIAAQGNLELAFLNLQQLMNVPSDERFDLIIPEINLESLTDPFAVQVDELFKSSWENQPSFKNAKTQLEIAETDQQIAKAGLKPTVGLGGSVGTNYSSLGKQINGTQEVIVDQTILFNGSEQTIGFVQQVPNLIDQPYFDQINENITYGYGLSVQVPIYNNYNTKAAIQKAEINKKNTNYSFEFAEQQFKNELQQVLQQARNAKKQYEASLVSVEATQQSLQNVKAGFEAGTSNAFDLNFATNAYDTALIQSIVSKYDYIFKTMIIDFYLGRSINF